MNRQSERQGKTFVSIAALLLVAIAAGALLVVEMKARNAGKMAYDRVNSALASGQSIDDAQVHDWLGRQATRTYDGEDKKFYEVYDYRGIFRTTTVEVEYTKRAATLVNAVILQ